MDCFRNAGVEVPPTIDFVKVRKCPFVLSRRFTLSFVHAYLFILFVCMSGYQGGFECLILCDGVE